jgi:hydrogenase maturation protein HypF
MGDLEGLAARERYLWHLNDWRKLYRFEAKRIAHDLHPEYFSTTWAIEQPLVPLGVQHHHAHIVAGMLEHGWLDQTVLGVAWDGTGYGTDGTIWGGEFLLARADRFDRFAHLRGFRLPGGEIAVREPWRTALAIAAETLGWEAAIRVVVPPDLAGYAAALTKITANPRFSPWTTSGGRLFDAAAAIILGIQQADFDGQPAMMLESAAERDATGSYDFPLRPGESEQLDWRPLFHGLLKDRAAGLAPGVLAMRFHRSVARGIAQICGRFPELPVVLSGGVFQNRLLTELILEDHGVAGQKLGLPGVIPPNDGGLAAGQLAVALYSRENAECA